jgi:transposase InsO family protein
MKAAIFIPCHQTIDTEGIAQLYANYVFSHYGAPRKVISDRDTRFTAQFSLELCRALGIERNISTACHPQTDGQSERTNQWLEQYLWIYGNYQQDDWARWLPLTQFVHNTWPSSTTGKTPFKLIMGHTPTLQGWIGSTNMPTLDQRKEHLQDVREKAQRAIQVVQHMAESTTSRRKGQQKY